MDSLRLIDSLRSIGLNPIRYSGRGMGGAACVAVTLSGRQSPFWLGWSLGYDGLPFVATETDSLGRDTVAYFPRMAWPDGGTARAR